MEFILGVLLRFEQTQIFRANRDAKLGAALPAALRRFCPADCVWLPAFLARGGFCVSHVETWQAPKRIARLSRKTGPTALLVVQPTRAAHELQHAPEDLGSATNIERTVGWFPRLRLVATPSFCSFESLPLPPAPSQTQQGMQVNLTGDSLDAQLISGTVDAAAVPALRRMPRKNPLVKP